NCAIRLTALLTPEASPSSAEPMLESTDVVSGATSAANETPSTAIGPITPNVSDEAWPMASQMKANAAPIGPTISMTLGPTASAKRPNAGDSTAMARVNGNNTSAAPVDDKPRRSIRLNGSRKNMMESPT